MRASPGRASPRYAGDSPRRYNAQGSGRSSRPSERPVGVSFLGERSPSPPSRSQPLRALARGDVNSSVSPADSAPADDDYNASRLGAEEDGTTPERHRGAKGGRVGAGADAAGVPPQTIPPLPRVADLEGTHRLALAKQRAKVAEAAALVKPAAARHRGGRTAGTALYHPSWYDPARADTSLPESELALEYVHGYAGETPGSAGPGGGVAGGGGFGGFGGGGEQVKGRVGGARQAATRSTNIMWLRTGEVVFPASAVVVIHDFETNRQRFFTGHDEVRWSRWGFLLYCARGLVELFPCLSWCKKRGTHVTVCFVSSALAGFVLSQEKGDPCYCVVGRFIDENKFICCEGARKGVLRARYSTAKRERLIDC